MKYLKYLSIIGIVCAVSTSCSKDFLDKTPVDTLTPEQAFADPSLVDAAVQGMYDQFQGSGYYGRDFYILPEIASDNLQLKDNNSGRFINTYNFSLTANDGDVSGAMNFGYQVVHAANLIIENADNCTTCTPEEIQDAIGNAYAARGLAHFDMTRMYSFPYNVTDASVAPGANGDGGNLGMPIILKGSSAELAPEDYARKTLKEVYTQVIADLEKAETMLPTSSPNGAYLSSMGASALLSRLYLYMGDYPKAIAKADRVISGPYALVPNAEYVDGWAEFSTKETIFSVVFTPADNLATNALGYMYITQGYGDFFLTSELYNLYDANDVRLGVFREKRGDYFNYKFPGREGVTGLANTPVIRLSEVILNKAEALAKLGGRDQDARTALDLIRLRANPAAAPTTASGDQLVKEVLLERRKEMAFEGQRLYDIVRNKEDMTRLPEDVTGTAAQKLTYPDTRMTFPIPKSETNVNTAIKQNEGY